MFLNRLNEITRPKVHTVDVDLGFGDGIEKIHFRSLAFAERQKIFGARAKEDGTIDMRDKGLHLMAELVAAMLCHEDGTRVVKLESALEWDGDLIDKLAAEAMKVINPSDQQDPSPGQS